MASHSKSVGTQCGGYLNRAVSSTSTWSESGARPATGEKWPSPVWPRTDRLYDATRTPSTSSGASLSSAPSPSSSQHARRIASRKHETVDRSARVGRASAPFQRATPANSSNDMPSRWNCARGTCVSTIESVYHRQTPFQRRRGSTPSAFRLIDSVVMPQNAGSDCVSYVSASLKYDLRPPAWSASAKSALPRLLERAGRWLGRGLL
mmetsp:Transcript_4759/g.15167  ORF Transcript_4759/g.15167 Transcript_4759/m.15167 type:complete len:207 (-) Transcript_4759:234-854(-)